MDKCRTSRKQVCHRFGGADLPFAVVAAGLIAFWLELAQAFTMNIATTMIASPQIGVDTKAWEFLTAFYDTNAMHPRNAVIVNEREFSRLPAAHQAAILKVAAQAEARGWDLARAAAKASTDTLAKNGLKVYEPTAAMRGDFERVSQKLIDEWSQRAGADGTKIVKAMK